MQRERQRNRSPKSSTDEEVGCETSASEISWETQEYISKARGRKDLTKRRLEVGFECGGECVGGRFYEPFIEKGLRSHDSIIQRRFVQMIPRAKDLQSSRCKEIMERTDSKLLALDNPYVVLNPKFLAIFRIDCDRIFPSWGALRAELEDLPLPCLPHAITGFEDEDGSVWRPHIFFSLPYGSEVWANRKDPRCKFKIVRFWHAVHAGITKALLPLGADPGALSNALRIKNPLSPFWTTEIWNETIWPTLDEWAGWVDTRTRRDRMVRESAAALSRTSKLVSNQYFDEFREMAFDTLRKMHRNEDSEYAHAILKRDPDALAKMLLKELEGPVCRRSENANQALAILYRVVPYAADHWDPSRADRDHCRDRGVCSAEVDGVEGVSERQAIGAKYSASKNSKSSLDMIVQAIKENLENGIPLNSITKSKISRETGLNRKTVDKYWTNLNSAAENSV